MAFEILKRGRYSLFAALITLLFAILFLYFDQFLFFSPYFVFYLPEGQVSLFSLDLALSVFSGIVLSLSIFQLFNVQKSNAVKGKNIGFAGIILALISGACPCYYLVPLLAAAGSAGGVLAFIGITLNTYQIPIKIASLALMGIVGIILERGLKTTCSLDYAKVF